MSFCSPYVAIAATTHFKRLSTNKEIWPSVEKKYGVQGVSRKCKMYFWNLRYDGFNLMEYYAHVSMGNFFLTMWYCRYYTPYCINAHPEKHTEHSIDFFKFTIGRVVLVSQIFCEALNVAAHNCLPPKQFLTLCTFLKNYSLRPPVEHHFFNDHVKSSFLIENMWIVSRLLVVRNK